MSSFQTAQGHAFRKLFYTTGAVTASMFVCGISLTFGQLISELFPDCTRSCFSQVVSFFFFFFFYSVFLYRYTSQTSSLVSP